MQPSVTWWLPIGGRDTRGLEWHGDDLPTGVTILSATKTISPATGLTVADPIVNSAADGISVLLTATTAGAYTVTLTATRSDGGQLPIVVRVEVDTVALSSGALVTLDEARSSLGWLAGQFVEQNVNLIAVIESASALIDSSVDCMLKSATYTAEAIDGSGRSYLYLPHYPVTTFTTCVEDGTTLTKDTDYFVDMDYGILEKPTGYKWTTTRRGVVNTYVAGYAAVPADVKLACLIEVARKFDLIQKKMFGESTRTQEGVSISVNTDELLPETLATLARYTRTRI